MNTKLANLLFEENNIKNIAQIFENTLFFENDQNDEEKSEYLKENNKTLLTFIPVKADQDGAGGYFHVYLVKKKENGKGQINCYKLQPSTFVLLGSPDQSEIDFTPKAFEDWSRKEIKKDKIKVSGKEFVVRESKKIEIGRALEELKKIRSAQELLGNNISEQTIEIFFLVYEEDKKDATEESDDENAEGEVEGESNEDLSSEQINLVNDIVEENGEELSVQELEGIKNNLDNIREEVKEDAKKQEIKELKVKLDKLIEDAKERETKVKSVQDLTESEKSNRKNALTIILQDVNRTIKSSKDENYKKEYEKELKLAKEKDLEDENATLVTGFTVGSVLSLALGLGVATAAAPVSGAVALSALAAGFVGMSPVGMAGAFLAKGKKGKETAASQVQPAKSYSADVAKDVEKLEKCVEVLVRQALRETKLIYKKGLRFLLEDIDDAESRRSKIKRYDQLEITKQDIKDTFVAEGFDFFIKNKKFLEKDQFEEFIDRLSSIFKVYHNIKVKDAVERDIAQETIASRKEEISIAARQLFNYIEANKQKIEQNFGQEASAQVEKLVSSATNKNVIANLPAPRLALQYSPETWAEEGIQGQGPYATVDPSDSEDDNWDSSSFDSLKSYDTEDTESSDEESSKETELNNSAFSGDFDEVDAEEESEESQQTTYENVDALASDIVKEVKNIQKQTNDAKDSIGKIYLSRDNNKAIVIYREKSKEDSDDFVAPIKIALIDKDISKEKTSDHAEVERGYAIYNQGVAGYDNAKIKRALGTLKNLNGKSPNQNRDYFKNTFVKKPNKFEQKTLRDVKFLSSNGYDIQHLINNIDFEKKNTRSLTQQDSPNPRQSINNVNAPEETQQAIEDATRDLDLEEVEEKTGLAKYVSQIDEIVQKNKKYNEYIKSYNRALRDLNEKISDLDESKRLRVSITDKGEIDAKQSSEGVDELISFIDKLCRTITSIYRSSNETNDKKLEKALTSDRKKINDIIFNDISNYLNTKTKQKNNKKGSSFIQPPNIGEESLVKTRYYYPADTIDKVEGKVTSILQVCVTNGFRIRLGEIA